MPQSAPVEAAWWVEIEDVRARIEQRRARDREDGMVIRSERVIDRGRRLEIVRPPAGGGFEHAAGGRIGARSHRRRSWRVRSNPDRIAGWAVVLGLLLVIVAIISAHG